MGWRISMTNYLATLTPTVTSEHASYPKANLATPQRPLRLYKTTAGGDQTITYDLGPGMLPQDSFDGTGFTGWSTFGEEAFITRTTPTPGLGFTGSVQRRDMGTGPFGYVRDWYTVNPEGFVVGKRYYISFKYRSLGTVQVNDRDTAILVLAPNTGNAIAVTTTYVKTTRYNWDWLNLMVFNNQWLEIDELVVREAGPVLGYVANANITAIRWMGNHVDSWTTPAFTQDIVLVKQPQTGRYGLGVHRSAWEYRYFRLLMWGQMPVHADWGVYEIGGLWFGPVFAHMDGVLAYPLGMPVLKPGRLQSADLDQFEDYVDGGPPRAVFEAQRRARTSIVTPGQGDELETWMAIDRAWGGVPACVMFSERDPRMTYIMRNTEAPLWQRERKNIATSRATMIEVLGP